MLGALAPFIPAAIGAVGSFFGSRSEAKSQDKANKQNIKFQRETNRQNREEAQLDREWQERFAKESAGWQFNDLMKAADESGIHRLTALGAGGGQSYQPVGGESIAPAVSPVEGMGSSLGKAVDSAVNQYRQTQQSKLNNRIANAQIKQMNAETDMMEAQAKTFEARAMRETRDAVAREEDSELAIMGITGAMDPNTSSAQEIEDRYGDLVSWVAGIGILGADTLATMRREQGVNSNKELADKLKNKTKAQVKAIATSADQAAKNKSKYGRRNN